MRAQNLRDLIKIFTLSEQRIKDLTSKKQKHINYLIKLLYSFYLFTNIIESTDNELIIQKVFQIYKKLFNYLNKQISKLQ